LPLTWRQREKVFDQFFEIGNASLLMVCILSFFIGGVIALQTGPLLVERGLGGYVGGVVGFSIAKELAPVMMAILIAGRIGSAMAAEIGSMRVYQEIDALRTMNINPVHYLVLPRLAEAIEKARADELAERCFAYVNADVAVSGTRFTGAGGTPGMLTTLGRVLRRIGAESGRPLPVPPLPVGVVGGLQWHESGRELGLSVSSARSPSDVYSVDFEQQRVARWTEGETGGVNAASFAEPEIVRWNSFDGRSISGLLYRPAARSISPISAISPDIPLGRAGCNTNGWRVSL